MNKRILFNTGWEFVKSGLEETNYEQLTFEPVDLPHDWLIYDTLNLYENSIGWYRKKLTYEIDNQQLLLCFDGVYMDSTLYVNQTFIGEWKYGYSSFEHDITSALHNGENEIMLKVVHQSPNSRWYSGAGIYRNVWLKTREENYIVTDGVYITTKQIGENWQVEVDTQLNVMEDMIVSHTITYQDQVVAESESIVAVKSNTPFTMDAKNQRLDQQVLYVEHPLLWDLDQPNLYQITTRLIKVNSDMTTEHGYVVEEVTQNLGFRTIQLDPNQGFCINGKKRKLNGVCEHHDLGALGAAFSKSALKRRLQILKEMGANAIRTSHNMPAPELMDLADEMGMLVLSEAFDMWERAKTPYDYARFFNEWYQKDVKSWILRDRNHPSLFLWSIGNEIYDTHAGERGQELTKLLMEEVHRYDPKGNAKVTIGSNYMPWENAQKCADIVKIAGYNYAEKYYQKHHEEHPDWVIYGSETASVVQSRGIYHFPYEQSLLADNDEQCSSLGNSTTSWGAKSVEACIIADRDAQFSLGQFIWTGFDYIGEPTPYHTKNSYLGQIDTATFPKDSYYIYQAEWTDYKKKPMIHILPYWDFSPGQMIDVRVCSNAPRIELQLDGNTVGTHDIDHRHGTQLVGWWKIPYGKGELKALAYDEDGKVIATDIKRSFQDAKSILLKADKSTMSADGSDVIFVEITTADEDGNIVENANNRVKVLVTGPGRLIGLDNGDSTDYDPYKGLSRRLFSGKLMAIIGATLEPGNIQIEVSSKGLESNTLELQALPVKESMIDRISATTKNHELPCIMGREDEVPLRKIEIISEYGKELNDTRRELKLQAVLHPQNTSYREVEWSVVNAAGIVSNIAKIDSEGLEAKITAIGDGDFQVRCMSKNGTDQTKLISQLEFSANGLGTAYKDPYQLISAGLYDYSKGEVGNGNERGVATSRDSETQVGFYDIDFGPYGSDTITISVFALSSEEYSLQIWEGMPEEKDSSLLADVIYQKESIWNVYQEETYRLSKRLHGITSLCFVLQKKVHIKGFCFEKKNRAFELNYANEGDHIYGDTFHIAENIIEGIGNNVSIEFKQMDFASVGITKLVLYGRSPIDQNTIQIRFSGTEGESNQLIEFTLSDGYMEREYQIDKISGIQDVTFVFLPGCNFDFGWFRFE